jgi:two-component system chemotaxis sensor kinase CheA
MELKLLGASNAMVRELDLKTERDYLRLLSFDRPGNEKASAEDETAPASGRRFKVDLVTVFARSSFQHIEYIREVADRILAGGPVKDTRKIDKISGNLQAGVMKLRLLRINSLFERLPRIVRDLSRKSNKKTDLSLLGGETEIDRKVIEQLIDPLIHLIRNAVDHGIESPMERIRKGKPESGSITVKAHQEGNQAIIEVIDDGKGLDIDAIRKEALKRKITPEETLASMTDEEIMNFIFTPGFSTRPRATPLSGRGVGLDADPPRRVRITRGIPRCLSKNRAI